MRSVYLKEMVIYFTSPIFYVVAFIFSLLTGIFFYNNMVYVSMLATQIAQMQNQTGISLSDILLRPFFLDVSMLVIFIVPLVSMRLYAEEKAHGTMELLFTYPLSDLQVLAGKYLAGYTVLALITLLSIGLLGLASSFATLDWGVVLTSYVGLLLMAGAFLALGIFASSLSRNQIVAAALTLGLVLVFWSLGWVADTLPEGLVAAVLENLSVVGHLPSFLKGVFSLKDLVFYPCFILFFLFLTLRVLESHSWRGHSA